MALAALTGLWLFHGNEARAVNFSSIIADEATNDSFPLAVDGAIAPIVADRHDHPGVLRVLKHLQADLEAVAGAKPLVSTADAPSGKAVVMVGTLGKSQLIDKLVQDGKLQEAGLKGLWDAFVIETVESPLPGVERALVIAGSDKRGTIFGIYELSAQIGVSPWYWWADVPIPKRPVLYVAPGRHSRGEPAVKYRGIFINDEAPALAGWVQEKFGGFNHKFYEKVFELVLRLRGNYLWPAMWGHAIYDDDSLSPTLADELGVVLATSHHEPMMRAHVEWERYGSGPWNYEKNEAKLKAFWREGIERMGANESIVTVGMRGDGDEPMTETANIALLERIIADQRTILGEVTRKNPVNIPQMWALYKEVQEYFDKGMRVPDDVTLMLCDDNWGNIRKLPKLDEGRRAGGYGIYYHFDYVGDPRNYKWLNTNPIARVWEQMHLAHQYGANRIWVVNVGDIKPMEFPTEFFLDYAWNPELWPAERLPKYTKQWAAEQFGDEHAAAIADILTAYLKFNGRRKPELIAPDTYSLVNYREAESIVDEYNALAEAAEKLSQKLPAECRDAFYQLVLHPVKACANLNELYVTAGLNRLYARQGRASTNDLAERVHELFAKDADLTRQFHESVAGGKWNHMMDQTHIGYDNWQQPDQNNMPAVEEIDVPAPAAMGLTVEGSEDWWPNGPNGRDDAPTMHLSRFQRQSPYVEIFNRGQTPFQYTAEVNEPWILVTPAQGVVDSQVRLEVDVDWGAAPARTHRTSMVVKGAGATCVVAVNVDEQQTPPKQPPIGFIEADGYISMEAEHFARAVDSDPVSWLCIPDMGRTLSAVTPMPVTVAAQTPGGSSPRLEYDVHLFNAGEATVQAYLSPTLNYHNTDGLRYAVSFDDEPPQIINMHADDSHPAWQRHVSDNINVAMSKHRIQTAGPHILKFWMVDPGVVLQKLVVATREIPPSYLGPPESQRSTPANQRQR